MDFMPMFSDKTKRPTGTPYKGVTIVTDKTPINAISIHEDIVSIPVSCIIDAYCDEMKADGEEFHKTADGFVDVDGNPTDIDHVTVMLTEYSSTGNVKFFDYHTERLLLTLSDSAVSIEFS